MILSLARALNLFVYLLAPASLAQKMRCVHYECSRLTSIFIGRTLFQLKEPFCQPFGNRRLVHCVPAPTPHSSPSAIDSHTPLPNTIPHSPSNDGSISFSNTGSHTDAHKGEIPAWESCGRIVEKERGDFYEFLACNFAIALIAVGVVFFRSKQLQTMQARQLAARIGLVRGVPGGWVNG